MIYGCSVEDRARTYSRKVYGVGVGPHPHLRHLPSQMTVHGDGEPWLGRGAGEWFEQYRFHLTKNLLLGGAAIAQMWEITWVHDTGQSSMGL